MNGIEHPFSKEFGTKFFLLYWGLIGQDFGFLNLSNVFLDRLRVPKYNFKAPNKLAFTISYFPINSFMLLGKQPSYDFPPKAVFVSSEVLKANVGTLAHLRHFRHFQFNKLNGIFKLLNFTAGIPGEMVLYWLF